MSNDLQLKRFVNNIFYITFTILHNLSRHWLFLLCIQYLDVERIFFVVYAISYQTFYFLSSCIQISFKENRACHRKAIMNWARFFLRWLTQLIKVFFFQNLDPYTDLQLNLKK